MLHYLACRIVRQAPSRTPFLWQLTTLQRGFTSATLVTKQAAQTIKVPTMGDSITEGTVVEWMVQPGQAVQPDDVVAMVETDKVTIEIKADIPGVITKHFSSVDETVEVGAPLYEIDTEAKPFDSAPSETSTTAAAEITATVSPTSTTTSTSSHAPKQVQQQLEQQQEHRSPKIHFLGKEGWAARLRATIAEQPTPSVVVDTTPISPMYGRPPFSEEEMEAFMLGGAEQAPKIIANSTGAKFSY